MWGPENNPKVKLRETAVKGSPGFGVRAEGERVSSGTYMLPAEEPGRMMANWVV